MYYLPYDVQHMTVENVQYTCTYSYTHTLATNLMSSSILNNAAIVQSLTLIGLQGKVQGNSTSNQECISPAQNLMYLHYTLYTICSTIHFMNPNSVLDVKTFPKCLSFGMAQGSTKKSRNKKMAYTHHNDAMTSAHDTIQHLWYPYGFCLKLIVPHADGVLVL